MTKTKIHLVTFIQKLIRLVYKDARGYQFEAISSNGNIYRHSEIYYSASSAEAKGRLWIKALMSEEFWNEGLLVSQTLYSPLEKINREPGAISSIEA